MSALQGAAHQKDLNLASGLNVLAATFENKSIQLVKRRFLNVSAEQVHQRRWLDLALNAANKTLFPASSSTWLKATIVIESFVETITVIVKKKLLITIVGRNLTSALYRIEYLIRHAQKIFSTSEVNISATGHLFFWL